MFELTFKNIDDILFKGSDSDIKKLETQYSKKLQDLEELKKSI